MIFRKIFGLALILIVSIIFLLACDVSNTQTPATGESPDTFNNSSTDYIIETPTPTMPSIQNRIQLSRVPKPGETAELTYTIDIGGSALGLYGPGLAKSKVWIDFAWVNVQGSYYEAKHMVSIPLNECLVSGESTWEGNALETRTGTIIRCEIQLPREGIWFINSHFQNEGVNSFPSGSIMVGVIDNMAAIISGSNEFISSPLGYLVNFPYGRVPDRVLDESSEPVILELNLSKAPKVGEEAILTCRITSPHDVSDFSAKVDFTKYQEGVTGTSFPDASLLKSGDLKWRGDLKAKESVEFFATIHFPEEGDWLIHAQGHSATSGSEVADEIKLSITNKIGSFGWKQYTIQFPKITIATKP